MRRGKERERSRKNPGKIREGIELLEDGRRKKIEWKEGWEMEYKEDESRNKRRRKERRNKWTRVQGVRFLYIVGRYRCFDRNTACIFMVKECRVPIGSDLAQFPYLPILESV